MIVLDASAALELVLRTDAGAEIARRIAPATETLHAPHVIDLEVAQVLRRYTAGRHLTPARASEALQDFLDLDLNRYSHDLLLPRIWELKDNVTAYDAAYLALGEALGAPLLTRDRRLRFVPGLKTPVELV
jgi:predicted nucleic acid-binding protein